MFGPNFLGSLMCSFFLMLVSLLCTFAPAPMLAGAFVLMRGTLTAMARLFRMRIRFLTALMRVLAGSLLVVF